VYRKYKTSAEISAGGKEYTKDVGSGGNPGLKRTRIGAIFKKSVVKTPFKLHKAESFELQIYPMKSSAGLSNLVRLSL
jgi:hypothetical protein